MKTQHQERAGYPLKPGDKITVRTKRAQWRGGKPFRVSKEYPLKIGKIYTVRGVDIHPASGVQVVWLVGLAGHQDWEASFPADSCRAVWISPEPAGPFAPEVVEVPVKVTNAIAAELGSAALYPNVEELFTVNAEDWVERNCHRWTHRISNLGMHATFQEYSASVAHALKREEAVTLSVPLSPLAYQNAVEIAERLGVDLETWLQAILAHFATRRVKQREFEALRDARSARHEAQKAKREALRREKEAKRDQRRGLN